MLDLVWLMCEKQGWETTRYQGGTSMKTREESLKRFKTDPDCWIMLTSLRAGGNLPTPIKGSGPNRLTLISR